jgi:hypothetical protein
MYLQNGQNRGLINMEFTFNATGDFKTEFKKYVDLLFEKASTLTQKQRIKLTEDVTEAYVSTTGQVPNGGQLDRLGSFILHNELTSMKSNKSKASEYPVFSDRQIETREREETDFILSTNYGTDGVKHGTGKRNTKTNMID